MVTRNELRVNPYSIIVEPISEAQMLKNIKPLSDSVVRMEEEIKFLKEKINNEMITRKEIVSSNKSDTHWMLGLIVTIALAIVALIFKK